MSLTTDPNHPDLGRGVSTAPVPQNKTHLILSEEERAKGFIRPVRLSYVHVGPPASKYPMRDLTDEEKEHHAQWNYVKFEQYPPEKLPLTGSFWTQERLDKANKGCGVVTSMPRAIAETYATKPDYYGSTYCCGCSKYLPVGAVGEFVWDGTDERVGT